METGVDAREGYLSVGEGKIFVAVGNVVDESISTLFWALKNFRKRDFCILHVHKPAQTISVRAKFTVDKLDVQQVRTYQEIEKKEMLDSLNEYLDICLRAGVRAETICIEMDSIKKGIIELIARHGIIKLVMGAASDKHYSREGVSEKTTMKASTPSSSIAMDGPISTTGQPHQPINKILSKSLNHDGAPSPQSKVNLANPVRDLFLRAISYSSETSRGSTRATSSSSSRRIAGIQTPWSHSEMSDYSSRLSVGSSEPIFLLKDERSDVKTMASSLRKSIGSLNDSSPASELVKESESLLEKKKKGKKELETERQELADSAQTMARLGAIHKELDELQEPWKKRKEEIVSLKRPQFFSVFSALDIESATENFNPSMKIGEGGFGNVYKALLRQTLVAIKKFHCHSLEGQSNSDFQREVDVLSKVRHPNLVTLIGACPEASSLVYEYLPNGNLEERLTCKDDTPPLSWKTRIRIAKEICSALIFLHSNEPHIIVHGDLKPSNILLDVNFVSKLGDFGIASFIPRDENSTSTAILYCIDGPKGTFAYIDPEFFATGILTPKADVYSFGVVLLQLLTGRPAMGLAKKVEIALGEGSLDTMLDASVGDWPLFQMKQLAQMALRCCELNRKHRPNLELEVWKLLQLLDHEIQI